MEEDSDLNKMSDLNKKIEQALSELGEKVIKHFREVMDSDMGINSKTGTNTLHDSNIYKEMDYKVDADRGMVEVLVNEYADYIDMGRMSNAEVSTGKFRPMKLGGFPPLDVIRDWIVRKLHVSPTNKLVYAIGYSIAEKGIRPRPVFSYAWKDIEDSLDDYLNSIFEAILEETTDWFNK